MGSPLSGVLACLFIELLESKPFKYILPNDIHYYKYIDGILIIYPDKHNIHPITQKLNQVEPTINFTYELEKKQLPTFSRHLTHKKQQRIRIQSSPL